MEMILKYGKNTKGDKEIGFSAGNGCIQNKDSVTKDSKINQ